MKGEIYHVEIQVSNLEKSLELYDGFLGALGYRRIYEHKMAWAGGWEAPTSGRFNALTSSLNTGIIGGVWV